MSAGAAQHEESPRKRRAAALSIASNSTLIVLKLVAGVLTGSVAVVTEAIHSGIDLIASVVAYFSVRKAGEPADELHRYGHDKIENLAAAIEGMLILVGSGVIVFASLRRLISGGTVEHLGFGIAVVAFSAVANLLVSAIIARTARTTASPALAGDAAHLRTDAYTSLAVLAGLALVQLTGAQWLDPVVALLVAGAIVTAGVRLLLGSSRVLVDEALPEHERAAIHRAVVAFGDRGVVGYHQLRTRRAGARRYVDLHLQFEAGTSLEQAHEIAHAIQDAIEARLHGADVLIHLEPADRVRPGTEWARTDEDAATGPEGVVPPSAN
ncbi:MAG TPA: cation diffusion facilitator family transporter [Conexibacter sp.]|nr:cation diffusion facilitator family transporter [Conexibacter sp.]